MVNDFTKVKVKCPKCNFEFDINATVFGADDDLTCFNCGLIFSITGSIRDALKEEIPKIKAEIERRINEAEKGNIKLSVKELNELRDALKKSVL